MIEIIPAIDIIEGQCVRLSQGDYTRRKSYSSDPLDMARRFEDIGARWLHLVDLDGAKADGPRNLHVLESIAAHTSLSIEWGGGIKSSESLTSVFSSGAHSAVCGSIAIRKPELFMQWLRDFGGERIILGADVRGEMVSISGWQEDTTLTIDSLVRQMQPQGLTNVICTDISRDGMLGGPSTGLYRRLVNTYPDIIFTASGGIGSTDDLLALERIGMKRAIVGKAIYENRISPEQLAEAFRRAGTKGSLD